MSPLLLSLVLLRKHHLRIDPALALPILNGKHHSGASRSRSRFRIGQDKVPHEFHTLTTAATGIDIVRVHSDPLGQ
jgi:hypothetical protein